MNYEGTRMVNFYAVLGKEDNYKFLTPFTKSSEDERLKVIKIGKLKEYVESDLNILKLVYEPNGLTKENMMSDVMMDADLVTLSNKKGVEVLLPSTYLTVMDVDKRTYTYNRRALVIDLGALEQTEKLETLKNDIADACVNNIGKIVDIKEVPLTTDVYVSSDEHETKQADRSVTINGAVNNISRITMLEKALQAKQKEIDSLMCIIKKKY